jgi:hypothetical protein
MRLMGAMNTMRLMSAMRHWCAMVGVARCNMMNA